MEIFPGTDIQNSGFLLFEVSKWVATITNSAGLLFEKLQIYGTEGQCDMAEFTVTCKVSGDDW